MGVFGAFFGRRGDAGFKVSLLGASSGVGGFSVATLSRLVREIVRPAWPDGGREREVVRPARSKHPKIGIFTLAGRTFSRKSRWRGGAGRVFRANRPCAQVLDAAPRTSGWLRWGVLHYMNLSDGVSPACRSLM